MKNTIANIIVAKQNTYKTNPMNTDTFKPCSGNDKNTITSNKIENKTMSILKRFHLCFFFTFKSLEQADSSYSLP